MATLTGNELHVTEPRKFFQGCVIISHVGKSSWGNMRILSWNINGLRSLGPKEKFNETLLSLNADIICFQETKVTRDMLEESYAILPDFTSYFSFSKKKTGYSGVATFCKTEFRPFGAESGMSGALLSIQKSSLSDLESLNLEFSIEELKDLDAEGRCVITLHKYTTGTDTIYLAVMNLYCPRADPEKPEREIFKLKFYKLVEMRAQMFTNLGYHVVILGDINTSHKRIDHCEPYEDFELRQDRQWLDHFLVEQNLSKSNNEVLNTRKRDDEKDSIPEWEMRNFKAESYQFIDSFRHFNPELKDAFTCWNTKMNCRSTNFGTRLDYILVSQDLVRYLERADIHPNVEGSDHCPVSAEFRVQVLASEKLPQLCTKNFPEFCGKQVKLSQYFSNPETKKRNLDEKSGRAVSSEKIKISSANKIEQLFFVKPKISSEQIENIEVSELDREAQSAIYNSVMRSKKPINSDNNSVGAWKKIFTGPPEAPNCKGHNEPSVLRTVKKKGPNLGKQFWCCSRGKGEPTTRRQDVTFSSGSNETSFFVMTKAISI